MEVDDKDSEDHSLMELPGDMLKERFKLTGHRSRAPKEKQYCDSHLAPFYKIELVTSRVCCFRSQSGAFLKWSISGFYVYDDKRKVSPDTKIKKYIDKARGGIMLRGNLVGSKYIHRRLNEW